jgi:flagellar hook-associated protein 2
LTIEATDTLEIVRDKINALGSGVSASIVNDVNGARLVMTAKETGVANGFRIRVPDPDPANPGQFLTDGTGLSALAYDPENNTQGTTRNQSASDAVATINGIEVRSGSNTFTNVLSGISLTVGKVTSGPISVSIGQDTTGITTAITDFANAFTSLNSLLRTNTKYDEGSKSGGTLQGDSMAVSVLNQFRSLFSSPSLGGSTFTTLSAIGLQSKSGGTLSIDTTKLNDALNNLSEVRKLFSNADTVDPNKNGFATQVNKLASDLLRSDGVFSTRTSGLSESIKRNEKRQEEIDAKAALYEKRLRAQYTALDKAMAGLSTQSNYVSQMISGMNSKSNS